MRKKLILLIFTSLVIISILSGCCNNIQGTKTAYGVEITVDYAPPACGNEYSVWINNTNNFSVRIKQVWQFHGETTQWIDEFEPFETRHQEFDQQMGWHIYTINGTEMGWISWY